MEHRAFHGSRYKRGGMMIWGFSHHKTPDELDGPDFTLNTIESLAFTGQHWFFNRIRSFFGNQEPEEFWQSVAFANSLPNTVPSDGRYSNGSPEQRHGVADRVRRILTELAPSKAVLFSTKAWKLWPALNGSRSEPAHVLITEPELQYGTYDFGVGHEIRAYQLPHPQFQNTQRMTQS